MTVRIGPLADFAAMRRLGVACGIEDEGRDDEGILAAWGARDGEKLVGAVALEHQGGLDTPNWLAVDQSYRRRGIAAALYAALEREARRRGISRLWVTARAPAFFVAQGYRGRSARRRSATPCSAAVTIVRSSAASASRGR